MNPELKQRLIGAAVVTALATIFIPMLFDDPVDNKSQSVSELTIPAAPIKSTEVSANKLPTPASKNLQKPQEPSDTDEDPSEPAMEAPIADDAEAEASASTSPVDQPVPEQATSEPEEDVPTESLDTGLVAEAKSPAKPVEKAISEAPKPPSVPVKPVIHKIEPQPKPVPAPVKPVMHKIEPPPKPVLAPVKPVTHKAEPQPKPVPEPVKPVTHKEITPKAVVKPVVPALEKPAKAPELTRWTIHAGSFGKKDNATALMKTLREQGIPVSIETVPSGKGPLYRLKVGPELDKKRAAANKAKLDKQGVANVLIAE